MRMFSGPEGKCEACGSVLFKEFIYCVGRSHRFFGLSVPHGVVTSLAAAPAGGSYWECIPPAGKEMPQATHKDPVIHRFCAACGIMFTEKPLDAATNSPRDAFIVEVSRILRQTGSGHVEELIAELERRVPPGPVAPEVDPVKQSWLRRLFVEPKGVR